MKFFYNGNDINESDIRVRVFEDDVFDDLVGDSEEPRESKVQELTITKNIRRTGWGNITEFIVEFKLNRDVFIKAESDDENIFYFKVNKKTGSPKTKIFLFMEYRKV